MTMNCKAKRKNLQIFLNRSLTPVEHGYWSRITLLIYYNCNGQQSKCDLAFYQKMHHAKVVLIFDFHNWTSRAYLHVNIENIELDTLSKYKVNMILCRHITFIMHEKKIFCFISSTDYITNNIIWSIYCRQEGTN